MKTEISHPVADLTVTGWLPGRLPQPDITLEPNAQYRPPHEVAAPASCQDQSGTSGALGSGLRLHLMDLWHLSKFASRGLSGE